MLAASAEQLDGTANPPHSGRSQGRTSHRKMPFVVAIRSDKNYMGVEPKIEENPQIIHLFIGFGTIINPYFWKHPHKT